MLTFTFEVRNAHQQITTTIRRGRLFLISKITLFVLIILLFPCFLKAQQTTIPVKTHFISLLSFGGPAFPLGLSYGQMLTDRFSMEIGIGVLTLGTGIEYSMTNPRRHRFNIITGLYGSFSTKAHPLFSIPFGMSYLTTKNYQFILQAVIRYPNTEIYVANRNIISFCPGLTIRKKFGLDVENMKIESKAWFFNDFVFKTEIFRNVIAQNPNIIIEKILTNRFSMEAEYIYRHRDWESTGGEWDFGHFCKSSGYTFGLQSKFYISSKSSAPNAWYIAVQYRYNSTLIKNLEMKTFHNDYSRTVDLSKKGNEIGSLIGRQFFVFKNLTTDISIGIGSYWLTQEEYFVAGNAEQLVKKMAFPREKLYLNLAFGYFIKKG